MTAATPVFTWTYDPERNRYVIWRGGSVYQVIVPSRHNPAHGERYVRRCVDVLNGATNG